MATKYFDKAIQAVIKNGFLLHFPIKNKKAPNSVWRELYPRTEMRWEWDDSADSKVVYMWRLREELATSKEVVYGKFYQGRATVLSKEVFKNILALKLAQLKDPEGELRLFLSREAKIILEALEIDSPLSTKQLREVSDLKGRLLEPLFHRALKELWNNYLIVGIGEIEDGAFPSLAHAATKVAFEEEWLEALEIPPDLALKRLKGIPESQLLLKSLKLE